MGILSAYLICTCLFNLCFHVLIFYGFHMSWSYHSDLDHSRLSYFSSIDFTVMCAALFFIIIVLFFDWCVSMNVAWWCSKVVCCVCVFLQWSTPPVHPRKVRDGQTAAVVRATRVCSRKTLWRVAVCSRVFFIVLDFSCTKSSM